MNEVASPYRRGYLLGSVHPIYEVLILERGFSALAALVNELLEGGRHYPVSETSGGAVLVFLGVEGRVLDAAEIALSKGLSLPASFPRQRRVEVVVVFLLGGYGYRHRGVLGVEVASRVVHPQGGLVLSPLQTLKVNARAEGVLPDLIRMREPSVGVLVQHLAQQIHRLPGYVPGELQLGLAHNVLVHPHPVLVVVRRQPSEHLVQQRAQLVEVEAVPMALLPQHFGRHVFRRAAKRLREVVGAEVHLREAEISEAEVAVGIHEHVLWFQVSVDHVLAMQVLQGQEYLCETDLRLGFRQLAVELRDVVEELAARAEVHYEVQIVFLDRIRHQYLQM